MKKTLLALMLSFAAGAARADMTMLGNDPLSKQILSSTSQNNGGVTAAVRVGTGQSIPLNMSDAPAAVLAPAVTDPAKPLKPAKGLVPKKPRPRPKFKGIRRKAVEQLKSMNAVKDWSPTL